LRGRAFGTRGKKRAGQTLSKRPIRRLSTRESKKISAAVLMHPEEGMDGDRG